ncbi:MAG: SRPBCC domain-containing protein [Gemmatimonadota bacterium]|nr:SRPBCC domain-containing protein [Gemmatimonadota bacterium]
MSDANEKRPTRSVEHEVEIDAPIERVWRALTEADELERWFPLEAEVEPGEGGSIRMSWRNEFEGTSEIVEWDPPRHLRTTWGPPPDDEDAPAMFTDYTLEAKGGSTVLRVVTSGFPADESWDDWVEGTRRGWRYELYSLKHYLERHADEDRRVVYLRHRTSLPREEAWERLTGPEGFGGGPPLGGAPFDERPPRQWAAVLAEPEDALLRVSVEPTGPGLDARDATLFLAVWGEAADERLETLEREWAATLERLFPEGETL